MLRHAGHLAPLRGLCDPADSTEDSPRAIRASPRSAEAAGAPTGRAHRQGDRTCCAVRPLRCGKSLPLVTPSLATPDPRNASKASLVRPDVPVSGASQLSQANVSSCSGRLSTSPVECAAGNGARYSDFEHLLAASLSARANRTRPSKLEPVRGLPAFQLRIHRAAINPAAVRFARVA